MYLQLKVSQRSQDIQGSMRKVGCCELYPQRALMANLNVNGQRKGKECTCFGAVLS